MEDSQLLARISSFPRWHYEFDLRGHKTPIFDVGHINRHRQREAYFFRPLLDLCGGCLEGKRVLDLGCNAGYWSLRAVEAGCAYVLGVDGRPMHVEQAEFVFETMGVSRDRYEFRCANVFDYLGGACGQFDVVLCLGLLYHVNRHVTLLEGISRINVDLLLIDTGLSLRPGSVLDLLSEPIDEPRNACDYELVMVPSRLAVRDMVRLFGYECLMLRPDFTNYSGAEDFQAGYRRAFVCAKRSGLDVLRGRAEEFESESPHSTAKGATWFTAAWRRLVRGFRN